MKRHRISAFTLVEVLTGIVVLGVMSTCSWFAVSTLFRGEQLTRNRTVAINLLQKSQEEIRNASLTFYDTLDDCQFPDVNIPINCGLQLLGTAFDGYTRSVSITPSPEYASPEIKQAIITVNWTDQGKTLSMHSAVLLARPPSPLPGNIYGTVRSNDPPNALIKGVSITAELIGGGPTSEASSKAALGVIKNENYDFNTDTGAFTLPVGNWQLTAKHPSFKDYTYPTNITVTSNSESRVDFTMIPNPLDAKIHIQLIDATTKTPLAKFLNGSYAIFDDSKTFKTVNNAPSSNHAITFTDTNPKSFTISTFLAYRAGYAGKPNCSNFAYSIQGWSSAVVDETNSILSCGNPYNGSSFSDRIIVNSGDDITVNVPLYPVPMARINGKVIDEDGIGIAGASVSAKWPSFEGVVASWYQNGTYPVAITDKNGNYSYLVPAVQEMFENNNTGALTIQAIGEVPVNGCCNKNDTVKKESNKLLVKNLFSGSNLNISDLMIPNATSAICGNVQGIITNGATGFGINTVAINIMSLTTTTNSSGDYIYQCPSDGFKIQHGRSRFYASQNQYYAYDSNGNLWYSSTPGVLVIPNQMTDYPAKLWPIGRGTIIINVLDAGTGNPIKGAQIKLTVYTGTATTLITDINGKQTFLGILETWPPPSLPNDPYYKKTSQKHIFTVVDPANNYEPYSGSIPSLQKDSILTIDVKLIPIEHGGA